MTLVEIIDVAEIVDARAELREQMNRVESEQRVAPSLRENSVQMVARVDSHGHLLLPHGGIVAKTRYLHNLHVGVVLLHDDSR